MQIDNFYFSINFIVIDVELVINTCLQILVILGRSFLATVNVVINCRNEVVKLSFGNMTLELNMFNVWKLPCIDMEVHKVNLIEGAYEVDGIMPLCFFDPWDMALVTDMQFIEKINLHDAYQFVDYLNNVQCIYTAGWISQKEQWKSYFNCKES